MNIYTKFVFFSIIASILSLSVIYGVSYYVSSDGFSSNESIFYGMLVAFMYFLVSFIMDTIFLTQYKQDCKNENVTAIKKRFQFLAITIFPFLFIIIIDWLYFTFIDSSIPKMHVESIANVLITNGQDADVVHSLAQLPLIAQNAFTILLGKIMSSLFAILLSSSITKKKEQMY
jgi:hypothetical protein